MKTLKMGLGVMLSIGVGTILKNGVKLVMPMGGTNLVVKACVGITTMVIASMVANKVVSHGEVILDEAVYNIKSLIPSNEV